MSAYSSLSLTLSLSEHLTPSVHFELRVYSGSSRYPMCEHTSQGDCAGERVGRVIAGGRLPGWIIPDTPGSGHSSLLIHGQGGVDLPLYGGLSVTRERGLGLVRRLGVALLY
jgi:hypothetical protein